MTLHCKKCLVGHSRQVLGAPCDTAGCDGVIEEAPEFRSLVDELPEPMTCGRRGDSFMIEPAIPFVGAGQGKDRWLKFKAAHGNRVCSYRGSLHPDDMFALVKASSEAPVDARHNSVVEIEPSDKRYKIYVHQPGVRNAHEGAIKFYTHHLPRDAEGKIAVTPEQEAQFSLAVRNSHRRFEAQWNSGEVK